MKNLIIVLVAILLVALPLIGACGGDDEDGEATPTPMSTPTPTPSPTPTPTPTPTSDGEESEVIEVLYRGYPNEYAIRIADESGPVRHHFDRHVSFEYDGMGRRTRSTFEISNDERSYEKSGNTYMIAGTIWIDLDWGEVGSSPEATVTYRLTVSGGVFGDTPQVFEKLRPTS